MGLRMVTGGHSGKGWLPIAGDREDKRNTPATQSRAYTDPKMTGIRQSVVMREKRDNVAIPGYMALVTRVTSHESRQTVQSIKVDKNSIVYAKKNLNDLRSMKERKVKFYMGNKKF